MSSQNLEICSLISEWVGLLNVFPVNCLKKDPWWSFKVLLVGELIFESHSQLVEYWHYQMADLT